MAHSRLIKSLILLACTLAFCIVAVLLLHRKPHPPQPFAEADNAEKVTLQTGAASVELYRDSATWTVMGQGNKTLYRADSRRAKALMTALKNIRVEDVISERADRAGEFELNPESATHISLYGARSAPIGEGVVGKQAPDVTHLYFKFPDQATIYLARGAVRRELGQPDLKTWRDPQLLNFVEDQVLTLVIQGPGFTSALARSSDTWSCNGNLIDSSSAWGLLGRLAHLPVDGYVDLSKRPDLSEDKLRYGTVRIQLKDGKTAVLRFGKRDPTTQSLPVAVQNTPGVAWIREDYTKSILQKPSEFQRLSSSPAASSRGSKDGFPANNRGE